MQNNRDLEKLVRLSLQEKNEEGKTLHNYNLGNTCNHSGSSNFTVEELLNVVKEIEEKEKNNEAELNVSLCKKTNI